MIRANLDMQLLTVENETERTIDALEREPKNQALADRHLELMERHGRLVRKLMDNPWADRGIDDHQNPYVG